MLAGLELLTILQKMQVNAGQEFVIGGYTLGGLPIKLPTMPSNANPSACREKSLK